MYQKAKYCQIPGLEDMYLELFGYRSDGFFVDVGAFDCEQWSNTWGLAMAGWGGVFIEPQGEYMERCSEQFSGRGDITLIQAAVSNRDGKAALRLSGSVSTIKRSRALEYADSKEFGHIGTATAEMVEVKTITLDRILNEYDPRSFEVLSIDVEGSEMDVLNGFSIQYWSPKMVIVEVHEQHPEEIINHRAPEINRYFEIAGYTKTYSDVINNIYVKK